MKYKSIVRRVVAFTAAMGCMLADVSAYAAESTFNPIYSGKFTFATSSIEISNNDVVLTKVWYKISSSTSNFVSADDPDKLIFDMSQFYVSYDHPGKIVDLYTNEFKGYTPQNAFIETREVDFTFNIFGKVKSAIIYYNDRDYHSS